MTQLDALERRGLAESRATKIKYILYVTAPFFCCTLRLGPTSSESGACYGTPPSSPGVVITSCNDWSDLKATKANHCWAKLANL